jgi:hypothetical protein
MEGGARALLPREFYSTYLTLLCIIATSPGSLSPGWPRLRWSALWG